MLSTLLFFILHAAPDPAATEPDQAQKDPKDVAEQGRRVVIDDADLDFGAPSAPSSSGKDPDTRKASSSEDSGRPSMCWIRPSKIRSADFERLREAFESAGLATRPAHVDYPIIQIKSASREGSLYNCAAIIDVTVKRLARRSQIVLDTRELNAPAPAVDGSITVELSEIEEALFKPEWQKIWEFFSPPAPPPPPKEPDPPANFVDTELEREQALAKEIKLAPQHGPILSALLTLGYFSRRVSDAPGVAQDTVNAASIGIDAIFHLDDVLLVHQEHDIEFFAGYRSRLATAKRADEPVDVSADRVAVGGVYRYHLGPEYLPRIGGSIGYEFLRFELGAPSGALSTRYSVLRAALSVQQPLLQSQDMTLFAELEPALRLAPGGSGGADALAFDLGGGITLQMPVGLFATLRARYTKHGGETFGRTYTEGYLDAELGMGWSL